MPEQVAAAAIKKIGRFERFASAFAVSHVVYHMIPASPIGWGLAPMSVGRVPCAKAAVATSARIEKEDMSFISEQTHGRENGFEAFRKNLSHCDIFCSRKSQISSFPFCNSLLDLARVFT